MALIFVLHGQHIVRGGYYNYGSLCVGGWESRGVNEARFWIFKNKGSDKNHRCFVFVSVSFLYHNLYIPAYYLKRGTI